MSRPFDQTIFRPVAPQVVAYTASAGTSSAVGANTNAVRIVCTTAAYISFGTTATTSDIYVPANVPENFSITPGTTVSAIQVASGGNLHVAELTQ